MGERREIMPEPQATHRQRNYDICKAVDLTRLGVVLDKMVADGTISEKQAAAAKGVGDGLRNWLCDSNDQLLEKGND